MQADKLITASEAVVWIGFQKDGLNTDNLFAELLSQYPEEEISEKIIEQVCGEAAEKVSEAASRLKEAACLGHIKIRAVNIEGNSHLEDVPLGVLQRADVGIDAWGNRLEYIRVGGMEYPHEKMLRGMIRYGSKDALTNLPEGYKLKLPSTTAWHSLILNSTELLAHFSPDAVRKNPPDKVKARIIDRGGRTPIYDWASFDKEMLRIANGIDGLPEKRELTKMMREWVAQNWDKQPEDSQIRERVSQRYPHKK